MMTDTAKSTSSKHQFSDSVLGQILVGVVIAAASAFISWVVARATHVPPPPPKPEARITPVEIVATANEPVEFTAEESKVPSDKQPMYEWKVSGLDLNISPTAQCVDKDAIISCRFMLPGTFAVSVNVKDENGQTDTAASSVTVSTPNGYFGLLIRTSDSDAFKSILYEVDWVKLQSLITRPIVLIDPATNIPMYAALVERPANVEDPPKWRGAARGLKIAVPPLPSAVRQEFEAELLKVGVTPIAIPFSEVFVATEKGAVDLGFVIIESPDSLKKLNQ